MTSYVADRKIILRVYLWRGKKNKINQVREIINI